MNPSPQNSSDVFDKNLDKQKPSLKNLKKIHLNINPKLKKILITSAISIFSGLTFILLFLFIFAYLPGKKVYNQIISIKDKRSSMQNTLKSKNLVSIETELDNLNLDLDAINHNYQKLKLIGSFPFIKSYFQDGQNLITIGKQSIDTGKIVIEAIKPYQDFLGFQGSATSSADTAEDRIAFLTDSVESILLQLDLIEQKVADIQQSLNNIDSKRYPEQFKDYQVRQTIITAQTTVDKIHKLVKDGKPILENTPWLLGKDSPRKYFLLFQNDAELRPSGGFWTAYGILEVNNGKVTPLVSSDIYSLDDLFKSTIPAPRPIKDYHINIPYWYLRDMNISPDFPTNAQMFIENYQKISKQEFDAIIALDTQVMVDLVEILGRVGVPGYGNFSADPDKRCNGCPNIIYELENIAGRPRNYIEDNRKGFLAPLLHSLLTNAMGSPKEKMGPLAQVFLKNLEQKHILFYFLDEDLQQAGELANITGNIQTTDQNTDYFHLNDSNMASAKTNLFIQQKIKHQIITKDGQVEHQITISYNNPFKASNCNLEKGDLCLNAPKYRDWFRFYTPLGSQLVKMTGSEVQPLEYEELGKQVFEGFYGDKYPLYAESSNMVSIQYTSSVKASKNYQLLLQKQAGTKAIPYLLIVNGKQMEPFDWIADKTIKIPL